MRSSIQTYTKPRSKGYFPFHCISPNLGRRQKAPRILRLGWKHSKWRSSKSLLKGAEQREVTEVQQEKHKDFWDYDWPKIGSLKVNELYRSLTEELGMVDPSHILSKWPIHRKYQTYKKRNFYSRKNSENLDEWLGYWEWMCLVIKREAWPSTWPFFYGWKLERKLEVNRR